MIAACPATNRYDILGNAKRYISRITEATPNDAALVVIRVPGTFPGAGKNCEKWKGRREKGILHS